MEESSRTDVRRLLKHFGVKADESVILHLANNPHSGPLQIRLVLEDLTDYGDTPPSKPLFLEVSGEIRR